MSLSGSIIGSNKMNAEEKTLEVTMKQEVLSLISGISYAVVPSWYDASLKDLKLDLIVPKHRNGHKPCPVIIWLCGGAYMVCDRTVWLPELIRFAREGYAVASVEYRCTNEVTFPQPLIDVKAAIRFLRAHAQEFCLDPDRFYVMGESAGGTMATLVGTTGGMKDFEQGSYLEYDSRVQGIVDFYGPTDFKITERTAAASDDIPDWCMKAFLGTSTYSENLVRASAISYVSEQTPPCLILHGLADQVVDPAHSKAFFKALKSHNVYTECYFLEDAIHGDDLFYQDEMIERILTFLRKIA